MLNVNDFEDDLFRHADIIGERAYLLEQKYGKRDLDDLIGDEAFYNDLSAMVTELSSSPLYFMASILISHNNFQGTVADPLTTLLNGFCRNDAFVEIVRDDINDRLGRDYIDRYWPLEDDDGEEG